MSKYQSENETGLCVALNDVASWPKNQKRSRNKKGIYFFYFLF